MNDLSPEARRTLAQAKSVQPRASQALRTRVKENVLRAVAAAPADPPLGAAGASSGLSKSAFAKLPAWTFPTLGAIAVIGGIATFGTQQPSTDQSRAAHREATTDSPASEVGSIGVQPSTERRMLDDEGLAQPHTDARPQNQSPASESEAPRSSHGTSSAPKPSAAGAAPRAPARARDGDLRAEMQILARAEAALRANEPLSALSILDTHARELSSGQLQGERDGLRLIAQCALGRAPQSALARYLTEHRDGVLQGRIRASCARFLP